MERVWRAGVEVYQAPIVDVVTTCQFPCWMSQHILGWWWVIAMLGWVVGEGPSYPILWSGLLPWFRYYGPDCSEVPSLWVVGAAFDFQRLLVVDRSSLDFDWSSLSDLGKFALIERCPGLSCNNCYCWLFEKCILCLSSTAPPFHIVPAQQRGTSYKCSLTLCWYCFTWLSSWGSVLGYSVNVTCLSWTIFGILRTSLLDQIVLRWCCVLITSTLPIDWLARQQW